MEENRKFSWSNLFIKVILVIIFVLFTIWLLSLSNKGLSNSLDVLTNNVFSENMEKMKEVGKEYFTIERLPEKVGDIETLTLEKMYEKKLILELKDKFGNACSAENSYVSIEKFDNEYQMKVYLECGEESDYIIVIMGCYDYCDTDICEKTEDVDNDVEEIEYEYKKSTGGKWSDWGKWSEWSKVSVTKTDYREIETKVEKEDYSYDKTITEIEYAELEASCPEGYKVTSDGTKCYKTVNSNKYENPVCPTVSGYTLTSQNGFTCNYSKTNTSTTNPVCPTVSGYTLTSQNGFTCNYSKTNTSTANPVCPTVSGYTLTSQNGFTCNYSKTNTSTANPVCPTVSGYTLTGRNGFTCNYSKTNTNTADPVCPTVSGYTLTGRNGFTCNYSKAGTSTADPVCPTVSGYTLTGRSGFTCSYKKTETVTADPVCPTKSGWTYTGRSGFTCNYKKTTSSYTLSYVSTETSSVVPGNTDTYVYEEVGDAQYVYDCNNTCAFRWIHTYKVYKKVYTTSTETTTGTASCPSGYSKSGNTCVKSTTSTTTKTASCPSGYSNVNGTCTKSTTSTTTKSASCPSGYSNVSGTCTKYTTSTTTKSASCPSGYSNVSGTCTKYTTSTTTKSASCPSGYSNVNGTCTKYTTGTTTKSASCPSGYSNVNGTCTKYTTSTTTKSASCPSGYDKSGNRCAKEVVSYTYKDLILSCPVDYELTDDGDKCYKEVLSTVTVTGTREVTYYRYRIREYIGGTVDYKWSESKNDKSLLDAGYKLTGRTR